MNITVIIIISINIIIIIVLDIVIINNFILIIVIVDIVNVVSTTIVLIILFLSLQSHGTNERGIIWPICLLHRCNNAIRKKKEKREDGLNDIKITPPPPYTYTASPTLGFIRSITLFLFVFLLLCCSFLLTSCLYFISHFLRLFPSSFPSFRSLIYVSLPCSLIFLAYHSFIALFASYFLPLPLSFFVLLAFSSPPRFLLVCPATISSSLLPCFNYPLHPSSSFH